MLSIKNGGLPFNSGKRAVSSQEGNAWLTFGIADLKTRIALMHVKSRRTPFPSHLLSPLHFCGFSESRERGQQNAWRRRLHNRHLLCFPGRVRCSAFFLRLPLICCLSIRVAFSCLGIFPASRDLRVIGSVARYLQEMQKLSNAGWAVSL